MDKGLIVAIAAAVPVIANIVSFTLMKLDKERAKKGAWRIRESTLFIAAACFGGLGGVLGMKLLRHKTKHWYFKVFFPLFLVLQIALLIAGAVLLFR